MQQVRRTEKFDRKRNGNSTGKVWGSGVAQLEERLLPTPEVCGSNPVIGKF